MDFLKLERNIYDTIKEEQIYPILKQFCSLEEEKLGKIAISNKGQIRFRSRKGLSRRNVSFNARGGGMICMNTTEKIRAD